MPQVFVLSETFGWGHWLDAWGHTNWANTHNWVFHFQWISQCLTVLRPTDTTWHTVVILQDDIDVMIVVASIALGEPAAMMMTKSTTMLSSCWQFIGWNYPWRNDRLSAFNSPYLGVPTIWTICIYSGAPRFTFCKAGKQITCDNLTGLTGPKLPPRNISRLHIFTSSHLHIVVESRGRRSDSVTIIMLMDDGEERNVRECLAVLF